MGSRTATSLLTSTLLLGDHGTPIVETVRQSVPLARRGTDRNTLSVCPIDLDTSDDEYVYEDEISITLDAVPRPILFGPDSTAVMSRFEVRVKDRSWNHKNRKRHLVMALWPYTLGWIDFVPFRGPNPAARGRETESTVSAFNVGLMPDVESLEDALRTLDELPYDPYNTDARYAVAGRFVYRNFMPAADRPTFYREPLKSGGEQSFVLGLVDDPKKVEADIIARHLETVTEAAANPHKHGGTETWSSSEKERLKRSANVVAFLAIRAAMAGYRNEDHRSEGTRAAKESGRSRGRVVDYACRIAREIGDKYIDPGDEHAGIPDDA